MTAIETTSTSSPASRRALFSSDTLRGWAYTLPALVFAAIFFIVPIALMTWHSLLKRSSGKILPDPTIANYEKFFEKDYLIGSLVNSLELTLATIAIALPLAYALAATIAFIVPRRWQIAALVLAVLPFWTSYVVRTYSWLLLLSERGLFNRALLDIGLISEPLTSGEQPRRRLDRVCPLLRHDHDVDDLCQHAPDPKEHHSCSPRPRRGHQPGSFLKSSCR